MITRRHFNYLGAAAALAMAVPGRSAIGDDLVYNDDGLIHQPWFLDSFLIMSEDLADAQADGKRLAVFWELKGCPYCKETHRVNLTQPNILDFVKSNFTVIQLNMIGSRIVTDFDGEELAESDLAKKWQVRFSPTIQFFTDDVASAEGKDGKANEVARIQGYFKPDHFLAMFEYVDEKAYEGQKFREFVSARQAG